MMLPQLREVVATGQSTVVTQDLDHEPRVTEVGEMHRSAVGVLKLDIGERLVDSEHRWEPPGLGRRTAQLSQEIACTSV